MIKTSFGFHTTTTNIFKCDTQCVYVYRLYILCPSDAGTYQQTAAIVKPSTKLYIIISADCINNGVSLVMSH